MIRWIHHLLEPHCPHCREEEQDKSICQSCEPLKHQLEIANYEKKQMMETILRMSNPQSMLPIAKAEIPEQIKSRTIPWVVRRQMLEAEDRERARLMRAADVDRGASGGVKVNIDKPIENQTSTSAISINQSATSINELEKELGIDEQKGIG